MLYEININPDRYLGEWKLADELVATVGPRTLRLLPGSYILEIGRFLRVPFAVIAGDDSLGDIVVPDEYSSSVSTSALEIHFNTRRVELYLNNYAGEWRINGVFEPGFDDHQHNDDIQLVPSSAMNSNGSSGALYRFSIGDDNSAMFLLVNGDSSQSLEVLPGTASSIGVEVQNKDEVHLKPIRVRIEDTNESDTRWRIDQVIDYVDTNGPESVMLIPGVPFYFRVLNKRYEVGIDENGIVNPASLGVGDANFVFCLD